MKSFKFHYKIIAVVLTIAFAFQSMAQVNEHTYTTGYSNIHNDSKSGFTCFFSGSYSTIHMAYDCGKPFHIQ